MIILKFEENRGLRLAIEPNQVIVMCELVGEWDRKADTPLLEIVLFNGKTYCVPDRERTLLDFINDQRGDNFNQEDKTLVLK